MPELVSKKILSHIERLCEYNRLPCSSDYDRAIDYVVDCISEQNCIVEDINLPGNFSYWSWKLPEEFNHWKDGRNDKKIQFDINKDIRLLDVIVRGSSDKELIFITHMCHPKPGANDNASGAAMMIELIKYYSANKPEISLRFLFTVEYWGTVAYFHTFESKKEKIIAGISLDMVGGDQDKSHSTLIVDEIPHHLSSDLDLILYDNLEKLTSKGKYRSIGLPVKFLRTQKLFFTGGSDHYILNDSSIGIPSTCINTYPDINYHSSEDTPDKISLVTIEVFFQTILNTIPEFSKSILGSLPKVITLNSVAIFQEITNYISGKLHKNDPPNFLKDSFLISHLVNIFIRKFGDKHAVLSYSIFTSACLIYKDIYQMDIKYIKIPELVFIKKNYLGPFYRESFFNSILDNHKKEMQLLSKEDSLYFSKAELCINYFTLGYSELEVCWLVDHHYESIGYYEKFLPYFNLLLEYAYLSRVLQK